MTEIRSIEKKDDAAIERIIRNCLIEYGANHAGCAWEDDWSHLSPCLRCIRGGTSSIAMIVR